MKKPAALLLCLVLAGRVFSQTALEFYTQGRQKYDAGDWYGATELFQEAVARNPVYGDAWFALAESAYELEEYALTLSYLTEAEKYTRNKTEIHNLRGFAFLAQGKLGDAEKVFNSVLAQYPNDLLSRFGLAELNIFYGRLSSAESLFLDTLKRDGTNRRALLSLALLCREMGKLPEANRYIEQALRFHSGDAEVHYLAAYLAAGTGNYAETERRARIAVQLRANYDKAYELLAWALFRQERYENALDICDFRIGRNRDAQSAWYLKALILQNTNRIEEAIQVYSGLLAIAPEDEITRSALEILARDGLAIEDPRRAGWARFHIAKAQDARRSYLFSTARYEYQRALQIDPRNTAARTGYARLLLDEGFPQSYLTQIEFAAREGTLPTAEKDSLEAYRALLTDTLGARWNTDPFYLDKTRWSLALFYTGGDVQLLHEGAGRIAARSAAELFAAIPSVAVTVQGAYSSFADSFRRARDAEQDYFAVTTFEENERELVFSASLYSARNGTKAADIRVFRTGNDRFASAIRRFATEILAALPQRGKIIAREGAKVLIDLGKIDGAAPEQTFTVLKGGSLSAADQGFGLKYAPEDVLGLVTVTRADEEISEGILSKTGFYDRVNLGDELIPAPSAPATGSPPAAQTPARGGFLGLGRRQDDSSPEEAARILPDSQGALKPPALTELLRGIR